MEGLWLVVLCWRAVLGRVAVRGGEVVVAVAMLNGVAGGGACVEVGVLDE